MRGVTRVYRSGLAVGQGQVARFCFQDRAWDWDRRRTRYTTVWDVDDQPAAITIWLERPNAYFQVLGRESVRQFFVALEAQNPPKERMLLLPRVAAIVATVVTKHLVALRSAAIGL